MNRLTIVLVNSLLLCLLFGCGSDAAKTTDPAAQRQELMRSFENIADQETGLLNEEAAQKFVDEAIAFSEAFPDDTLAALPLYRSAEVSRSIGDPKRAIKTYQQVTERYPTFYKTAEASFMLAFSYDEDMNDLDRAKAAYESFLAKYPDHTFADDAAMLLANLGKSDEEILRELEAQLKANEEAEMKEE